MRISTEVGHIQHLVLGAAQPEPAGDLEQRRVPEHRQPALAAPAADPPDLTVGVTGERLQRFGACRQIDVTAQMLRPAPAKHSGDYHTRTI
jgi:hypothetical protein